MTQHTLRPIIWKKRKSTWLFVRPLLSFFLAALFCGFPTATLLLLDSRIAPIRANHHYPPSITAMPQPFSTRFPTWYYTKGKRQPRILFSTTQEFPFTHTQHSRTTYVCSNSLNRKSKSNFDAENGNGTKCVNQAIFAWLYLFFWLHPDPTSLIIKSR